MMQLSEKGLTLILGDEGFRATVYKDDRGFDTIGYGHKIVAGEEHLLTATLSVADAKELAWMDYRDPIRAVNKLGAIRHINLTQNQFDAMVSLAENIGSGAFARSAVYHNMLLNDPLSAADAFLDYDKEHINGVVVTSTGLLARRKRERALFLTP